MSSPRSVRRLLRAALLALLLFCGAAAEAAGTFCGFCGRKIRRGGRCFKSGGGIYCSRSCAERDFEKSLPVCSVCGGKCRGRYTVANGNNFCSKCIRNPRCFICDIPAGGRKLADGRVICRSCNSGAITDSGEAERCFRRVRDDLKKNMGFYTGHRIGFALVDRPKLHQLAGNASGPPREMGLFSHHVRSCTTERRDARGKLVSSRTEKVSESFDIYALDHLTKEYLEYVCAHELAHDWQVENYPGIDDPTVREGFAEYIGWRYNRMRGRRRLNRRIEENTDPVYGDGFRRIKKIADAEGFEGVRRFLDSQQRRQGR